MKHVTALCSCVAVASVWTVAPAQQAEEQEFTYATYYICDVPRQTRVDEIVASEIAPVYDSAVERGIITAWGWLAHRTGGVWRRAHYYTAPTIEALFAAERRIDAELQASGADSDQEVAGICNSHEDYIWTALASSENRPPGRAHGVVGLFTYYVCDFAEQNRADELLTTVLAPVYDAHVGEGMFTSWAWQSHFVGGQYRRLATFTAEDYPTLLNTRGRVLEAVSENALAAQFNQICGSHSDYLWDIQIETR